MSRLAPALAALVMAAAWAIPARAQNAESDADRRVIDLTQGQKRQIDLRDKRCFLPAEVREEIVVCAPLDPERDRYPGRESLLSVQSTKTGVPRAPDFAKPSCKGQVGCVSFGKVPPIMPDIDVKALPQAPAGSDADKISKGEMKDR